eukprot:m.123825 g.123825  ORF g.123825 m.123825 type:complete len:399 (-) comp16266_c1_seq1:2195-3391(-)
MKKNNRNLTNKPSSLQQARTPHFIQTSQNTILFAFFFFSSHPQVADIVAGGAAAVGPHAVKVGRAVGLGHLVGVGLVAKRRDKEGRCLHQQLHGGLGVARVVRDNGERAARLEGAVHSLEKRLVEEPLPAAGPDGRVRVVDKHLVQRRIAHKDPKHVVSLAAEEQQVGQAEEDHLGPGQLHAVAPDLHSDPVGRVLVLLSVRGDPVAMSAADLQLDRPRVAKDFGELQMRLLLSVREDDAVGGLHAASRASHGRCDIASRLLEEGLDPLALGHGLLVTQLGEEVQRGALMELVAARRSGRRRISASVPVPALVSAETLVFAMALGDVAVADLLDGPLGQRESLLRTVFIADEGTRCGEGRVCRRRRVQLLPLHVLDAGPGLLHQQVVAADLDEVLKGA